MTVAVETQQHEVRCNLIYQGMDLFFALDNAVKTAGGSRSKTLKFDGMEWRITLYYQESGIQHPGSELPDGTPFEIETLREYRVDCKAVDGLEERKVNFHIAPRWQGMTSKSGEEIPVPPRLETGVNVAANGANLEAEKYPDLLRNALAVVDAGARHVEDDLHPYSNVQDLARYVRLHTDESGPVHARSGPIAQMGHLLENDRSGYRSLEQVDTDPNDRDLPGYRHKVILGSDRVREMTPEYPAPKEVKHYYAKHALSFEEDNPLRHPKLEVSYQASKWDETVRWRDLEDLNEELERTLYATLKSAGLSLYDHDRGSGGEPPLFVSDRYFDADAHHDAERVPTLGLDAIEQEQDNIVVKTLADGLSPVQWEAFETLITDGGEVSPKDIADEHDRHVGSVRRALGGIEDLIEREYGSVALKSRHVAEYVHQAVDEAREAWRRAAECGGKVLAAAEQEIEEAESALQAFASAHGIEIHQEDDRDIRVKIRNMGPLTTHEDVKEKIRDLANHWRDTNRDMNRLKSAKVDYQVNGSRVVHTGLWSLLRGNTGFGR